MTTNQENAMSEERDFDCCSPARPASPLPEGRADGRAQRAEALIAVIEHEHHIDTLREVARIATERADQLSALRAPAAPVVAVPGREAVALAIAKAADADACFDLPYVDDGSTSDAEDRDYFRRLADAALAVVAVPEAGEEK